ncbi:hypothetical protein MmiHf6_04770 [Methanimicrococcus hongohii]|uniref:Uncharacterized protein n=1 Tax=Methanimicrococcus hongohii TaxID=3028295 RepID=A0AA96UZW1_9EURY|nr:hypothetical protein MmiHf6_04770 [Methanimicrococcus sp. Hf6]
MNSNAKTQKEPKSSKNGSKPGDSIFHTNKFDETTALKDNFFPWKKK